MPMAIALSNSLGPQNPASPRSRTMSPTSTPLAGVGTDGLTSATPANAPEKEQDTAQGTSMPDLDTANQKKRDVRVCGVCHIEAGKYKCPQCTVSYCSVACNRTHKENHPPAPDKPEAEARRPPAPTGPTPRDDPYSVLLEHRSEFGRLFRKYPNLETDLAQIQQATLPPAEGATARKGGNLFAKLQVPGAFGGKNQVWSRDAGLRKGAEALRRARTDPGEKGDAVREYCDLVLYLLSRPGGNDLTNTVRQEVVAEDTDAIARLMREERERDDA